MITWLKQHPLVAYFGIAYLISWSIAVPLAIARLSGSDDAPYGLHYLVSFGPLLAAFIVTAMTEGGAGLRDLARRMGKWRVSLVWWLAALSPLLLYIVVVPILRLTSGEWPDFARFGVVNFLPPLNVGVALLLWLITFGFGEETGWRGFALPHLQQQHSALTASLILYAFWAGWHVPQFLYGFHDFGTVVGLLLGLLAGAVLLTWLYNGSGGSVLLVAVWHGLFDFITASGVGVGLVAAVFSTLVMLAGVGIVFVYKPANLAPAAKQVATSVS